jgi:hypothetical protein
LFRKRVFSMLKKLLDLIRKPESEELTPEPTVETTSPTTDVKVDWNDGPSEADGTSWSPRFFDTTTDWNAELGCLILRPAKLMGSNPNGRRCGHKEITDFIASNKDRGISIEIITCGAGGMHPEAIIIRHRNGKLEISSSHYCKPSDVDNETMNLVQKVINAFGAKLNFADYMTEWRQRYNRINDLSKKGEWHSVAESALLIGA